jgi:hypothetical protein
MIDPMRMVAKIEVKKKQSKLKQIEKEMVKQARNF